MIGSEIALSTRKVRSLEDLREWQGEVLRDEDLRYSGKYVLIVLSSYLDDDWLVSVEKSTISKETEISTSTLHKWWGEAVESGWVEVIDARAGSRGQHVEVFRLVFRG